MAGPDAGPSSPNAVWDERYRGRQLVWGAGPNRLLVEQVRARRAGG